MHEKYEKAIFYCPICGWVHISSCPGNKWDFDNWKTPHCHYHDKKELTLITDRTFESIYNQVAEEHGGKYMKTNGEIFYVAKKEHIVEFVRKEYVEAEDNELFEQNAYNMCLSMEEGAEIARERHARRAIAESRRNGCPRCHSTNYTTQQGFNTKRAVVGGLFAGITGAYIGANTGKTVRICNVCGHKWTP